MRLLVFVFCLSASAAAQIYVSPSGNDAGPGTQAQPVRTLQHARDLVRTRNRQMTSDLTPCIWLPARTA